MPPNSNFPTNSAPSFSPSFPTTFPASFLSQASSGHTASVLSGQQCALLGGSPLVLAKIFGVAALAKTHKLLPVYWVETNDSDWQEVNFIAFFDRNKNYEVLRWQPKTLTGKNFCIGDPVIDSNLITMLQHFFNAIPPTNNTAWLREAVFSSYKVGTTLASATIKLLKNLCSSFLPKNFIFFNPANEHFINFSRNFLLKEAQNTPPGQQCALFAKINGERISVFKNANSNENTYSYRNGKPLNLSKHILLPHLKTRSIIQDAYFNAQYYIAGPAEKIYLKKLLPQYKMHNTLPAKIMQRMHIPMLSKKEYQLWQNIALPQKTNAQANYFISLTHSQGHDTTKKHLLQNYCQFSSAMLKKKLQQEKNLYLKNIAATLPTANLRQLEKTIYWQNKHLLGQARQQAKKTITKELGQLFTLSPHLHPPKKNGLKSAAQERSISFLYLLNLYGQAPLKELANSYSFAKEKILIL